MRFVVLFFLTNVLLLGYSQNILVQQWVRPVAGSGSYRNLQSLDQDGDKFAMAGDIAIADTAFGCTTSDSGISKAWMLIDDTNGSKIYSRCYGGSEADGFQRACFGKNGSIWTVGGFNSTDGDFPNHGSGTRLAVVKFDSLYNPIWFHFYGSNGENDLADFITTSDGGALILASTNDTSGWYGR